MLLRPTAKARRELHPGVQTLTMRQRSVLLLAERREQAADLRRLFNGMGEQIVGELMARGYLAPDGEDAHPAPMDNERKRDITAIKPVQEDV